MMESFDRIGFLHNLNKKFQKVDNVINKLPISFYLKYIRMNLFILALLFFCNFSLVATGKLVYVYSNNGTDVILVLSGKQILDLE